MADTEHRPSEHRRLSEAVPARPDPTGIIVFLLTIQLITLFLIGASFYFSSSQVQGAAEDSRKGVACLIEQLAEHRFSQASAHRADASSHGYTYDIPADFRPPTDAEVQEVRRKLIVNCEGFLNGQVRP